MEQGQMITTRKRIYHIYGRDWDEALDEYHGSKSGAIEYLYSMLAEHPGAVMLIKLHLCYVNLDFTRMDNVTGAEIDHSDFPELLEDMANNMNDPHKYMIGRSIYTL